MQKKFDFRYSYIRIIAALAVVILHAVFVAFTLYQGEISRTAYKVTQGIVHNMMWAVPSFVMVTGSLLLEPSRKVSFEKLFKVYIKRVLVALIIAILAFRLFDMVMNHEPFSLSVIGDGLMKIVTGQTWGHMWYIYLLIGLYLLLPFYKKVADNSTPREILYLLVIYFIFESLILLFGLTETTTAFYIHVSSIYPFYLFAGYAFRRWGKGSAALWALVLILVTALIVMRSNIWCAGGHDRLEVLFGYSSPLVVIQSLAFYAMMMQSGKLLQKTAGAWGAFIRDIDNCSFGIYLIHLAFIRLFFKHMQINPYQKGYWFVLCVLISFFGSYIIVTVYKRLRKMVARDRKEHQE